MGCCSFGLKAQNPVNALKDTVAKNVQGVGITTNDSVNVRSEPNTWSAIPFNLKYENVPLIILGEVEGPNIRGTTKWYKIASDANLTSDRTRVSNSS